MGIFDGLVATCNCRIISSSTLKRNPKNFLKSTTSLTVAVLVIRSCKTISMKSTKEMLLSSCFSSSSSPSFAAFPRRAVLRNVINVASSVVSFSSKMMSAKSTRVTTSTSTAFSASTASLFCSILKNSDFCSFPSVFSSPSRFITSCKMDFTQLTLIASFSAAATAVMTSQRTPMSMFMTVMAARTMKRYINIIPMTLCSCSDSKTALTSSSNVPCKKRLCIAVITFENFSSPRSVSFRVCTIAMPKM
mmetsp:Transcript_46766/g.85603  ORF Transcript_46766/g.85603 Transcript_46766/m.85603 type:complete len:248 (-) Transcript_46766:887-1630(-)